jgi:ketosteroid isomerase-like protein
MSGTTGLIQLVERYFAAVDRKDVAATLACFASDATFVVASHHLRYEGRDTAIRAMYERLNARYEEVWHGDFDHVVEAPSRIASRFTVVNTSPERRLPAKFNCNFFRVRDGVFDQVVVYMSGDNSLA